MKLLQFGFYAFMALSSSLAFGASCQGDIWKEAQTGNTLGGQLEPVYKQLLTSCSIPSITRAMFNTDGCKTDSVSSIPVILQRNLPLDEKVIWNNRQSIARAFAYVYQDEKLFGDKSSESSELLLYKDSLAGGGLIPDGVSSITHSHDCASILSVAADTKFNLSISTASLRSGLNAVYSGKEKTSVVLTEGRFESPFFDLWESKKTEDQMLAAMYLYDWHLKSKYKADGKLLRTIKKGISIFSTSEITRNANGKLDFQATGSVGIADGDFQINASNTNIGTSRVNNHVVAIIGDKSLEFITMPKMTEVIKKVGGFKATTEIGKDMTVVPGTTVSHNQRMMGISEKHCRQGELIWTTTGEENIKLLATHPIKINNIPGCDFTIEYSAPALLAANEGVKTVPLSFFIQAIDSISEKNEPSRHLKFHASPVSYSINRDPTIFIGDLDVKPTLVTENLSLFWKNNLIIRDSAASSLDWAKEFNGNLIIKCQDYTQPLVTRIKTDAKLQTAEITFRVEANSSKIFNTWKKASESTDGYIRCLASGTLTLPSTSVKNGIIKPFSIGLFFPDATITKDAP